MGMIDKYQKHEIHLKYFEGWISGMELTTKDDGNSYLSFSIPLKKNKDDEPDWLNCKVYGAELVEKFFCDCKKGTRVGLWGVFKTGETSENKPYCYFIVKNYINFEKYQSKNAE